jgi:hypothetical protein
MKALRALLLGACAVAAPLALVAANAAEPSAITLYDAAGRPVAILTPIQAGAVRAAPSAWDLLRQADAQRAMPVADPFAQMDAMMNAMMARMNTLAAMPFTTGPDGAVNVAMPQGAGPGQVFISTFSSGGHGSCSQTVTYRMDGSGAQPQVLVHRVGDACGGVATPGARPVPAALPDQQPEVAPVPPSDQKIYKIDYRHKPAAQRPLHG